MLISLVQVVYIVILYDENISKIKMVCDFSIIKLLVGTQIQTMLVSLHSIPHIYIFPKTIKYQIILETYD